MNGVDVTGCIRNFTSDKWDKLRACGGHTYVSQCHEYLNGRQGSRGGRAGCGYHGGRYEGNSSQNASNNPKERNVFATNANTTEIVEYDASTIALQTSVSTDWGTLRPASQRMTRNPNAYESFAGVLGTKYINGQLNHQAPDGACNRSLHAGQRYHRRY